MIAIQLEGEREIMEALRELPVETARKFVKDGIRAGIKPILAETKANARSMVGGEMGNKIADAFVVANLGARPHRWGQKVWISPAKSADFIYISKAGNRYWIPSAIEFGHVIARKGMGGLLRKNIGKKWMAEERIGAGRVPAIPYLRKAVKSTEDIATETAITIIGEKIERYWAKQGRASDAI